MWFKQIRFYAVLPENLPDVAKIADKLAQMPCVEPAGLEWFSEGFAEPYSFLPEIVFSAQNTWAVSLKKIDKVLPTGVIRQFVDEKVAKIQATEERTVGRKEKQEIKEQITDDLLPKAFTRSSCTHAVYAAAHGLLLINQSNESKAANLVSKLREALGGLEARLPDTQQSPSSLMTDWLSRSACDGGFELDDSCELKGQGDVAPVVKIAKQDLTADEVLQHIKTGKTVTQLGLVWREQIAFVLTEDFVLKRIQYLDVLQEEAEQQGDDAASLAFASQILMAESISTMISELVTHLGGWQQKD